MEAALISLIVFEGTIIAGLVGWFGQRLWIKSDRLSSAIEQLSTLYAVHVAEHETLEGNLKWDGRERRKGTS